MKEETKYTGVIGDDVWRGLHYKATVITKEAIDRERWMTCLTILVLVLFMTVIVDTIIVEPADYRWTVAGVCFGYSISPFIRWAKLRMQK